MNFNAPLTLKATAATLALCATQAIAGNEAFARGNCTSPGRAIPTVMPVLEFQKYKPTMAVIAPGLRPAHLVGAMVEPAEKIKLSGRSGTQLLTDAEAALDACPAPQITRHFPHREGINVEATETGTRQGDLIHVLRRCAFYLTPEAYQTSIVSQLTSFGPMEIRPREQRKILDIGRLTTRYHAAGGQPTATANTGKGSSGGYLWLAALKTNDDADTPTPDWQLGGLYILTEMSDYLAPEDYRTE